MKNLVVFASGSGSNFQSIIDAVSNKQLQANISGLVSNNDTCFALERAQKNAIPTFSINPNTFENEADYCKQLLDQLDIWNADVLILAGYLRKIPEEIIAKFPNRILNIHPSLLPAYGGKGFYGKKVHQAVIENNEIESGCSVHIVTTEYDEGPVLGQSKVQLSENETAESLATKVLQQEHLLFPKVIQQHLNTLK